MNATNHLENALLNIEQAYAHAVNAIRSAHTEGVSNEELRKFSQFAAHIKDLASDIRSIRLEKKQ